MSVCVRERGTGERWGRQEREGGSEFGGVMEKEKGNQG